MGPGGGCLGSAVDMVTAACPNRPVQAGGQPLQKKAACGWFQLTQKLTFHPSEFPKVPKGKCLFVFFLTVLLFYQYIMVMLTLGFGTGTYDVLILLGQISYTAKKKGKKVYG